MTEYDKLADDYADEIARFELEYMAMMIKRTRTPSGEYNRGRVYGFLVAALAYANRIMDKMDPHTQSLICKAADELTEMTTPAMPVAKPKGVN